MAVSTMDGGAMETKAPLTPPADFMDIDMNLQGGTLSNGHHGKDSSPNTAPPTGNSTQATSLDEFEPTEVNGVDATAVKANHASSKLNADSIVPNDNSALPVASSSPVNNNNTNNNVIQLPEEGADNNPLDSNPPQPQEPTSSLLRTEPVTASSEQAINSNDHPQEQTSAQPSNQVNGTRDDHLQVTDSSAQAETPTPVPAATEVTTYSSTSDQPLTNRSPAQEPSITTTDVPHHPSVPVLDGKPPEEPLDPAPSPAQSANISTESKGPEPMALDQQASTTPQSPPKQSRPREDDEVEEPAAKRSKGDEVEESAVKRSTDDEAEKPAAKRLKVEEKSTSGAATESSNTEFKIPAQPSREPLSIVTQNPSEPANPITIPQKKQLIKTITNIKRSLDGKPFDKPVDPVALGIPTYFNVIKNPMDLRTLEEKLKRGDYASLEAFNSDFKLIIQNALAFNGPEHFVTGHARKMEATFERVMANLPGPEVQASATGDKKRKSSLPSASKVPSRRESRASLPAAPAPTPITPQSTPTFALNPQGIPLIRRDSTKGDGRPKREIHPPAPRDLPYANSKPKKKKYQAELKFCQHILTELGKPKYAQLTAPFATPVDPVALNIPDYHSVIKKPMDLRTVREKLDAGQYENAKEFEADVRLIFANCHKYNGSEHPIRGVAKALEEQFDAEMAQKRSWLYANSPVSGAQSATGSDSEEDDEEEEEEEVVNNDTTKQEQLTLLTQSIAEMSRQVEMLKAQPAAARKKVAKGGKPDKKAGKKATTAPAIKTEKKAPAKSKKEYVTYEQKQDISNRINSLSEKQMARALKIIRDNMPNLKGVQDDELELDIDELSDDVLRKLYDFVKKNSKTEEVRAPPVVSSSTVSTKKKNKPMTKEQQEAQIQNLKNITSQFQGDARPSIETAPQVDDVHHDSSGDEEDSEESEEE
ncbi:MAG: hypothetical protein Q9183_002126 [Haloplaca sp. 2 TL-2023]